MELMKGIGVSLGVVIGRAYVVDRDRVRVRRSDIPESEVKAEVTRFKNAVAASKDQLIDVRRKLSHDIGEEHGYILDSHLMILDDKMLIGGAIEIIRGEKVNSEFALREVLDRLGKIFDAMEDSYLRERKSDIEHVGERILRNLAGKQADPIGDMPQDAIVVSHDLTPADTFQMRKENVVAFVTDVGSNTSHTAIVARSLEIPAVVGLEDVTGRVSTGDPIIVDGARGIVVINPDPDTFLEYLERQRRYKYFEKELFKLADLPAITRDGHEVHMAGNVDLPDELDSVIKQGAKGIGLFRTEYLFLNRNRLPTEEEHFLAYKQMVENVDPQSVVIRTFDLGGDKIPIPEPISNEVNPALGLRAIRFSLRKPDIFKSQIRGILRASAYGKAKVMYPMISGVHEVRRANMALEEAKQELRDEGLPFDENIPVGAMVEIPSCAITTDVLAKEVDFLSVGTNDLIQYALAIDRLNEHVAYLYEPLHPAVLRFLKMIVDAGHAEGVPVAMCGEMAGEPLYALILMGLGFDELSMSPLSIPRMKKVIRQAELKEAVLLTEKTLKMATAEETRDFVIGYMAERFPEDVGINGSVKY
jgi:phosphotransferase system enzyme I (PtsI)